MNQSNQHPCFFSFLHICFANISLSCSFIQFFCSLFFLLTQSLLVSFVPSLFSVLFHLSVRPPSIYLFPTFTAAVSLLVAGAAAALPNGHQPFPLSAAMHPGWAVCVNLRVVDAAAAHLYQRGKGRLSHCIGKHCQVLDGCKAAFVVHSHSHQGHAGTHILESQVKALAVEVADLTHLSVQLHLSLTEVTLREALISSDGVDFGVAVLSCHTPEVPIRLDVEEVEGLLAGARHSRDAVAVAQSELELHENALAASACYPTRL